MGLVSRASLKGQHPVGNNTAPISLGGGAPHADSLVAGVVILLLIPGCVVGLRVYVRTRVVKVFGRDDFFMLLGMICAIGTTIAVAFEAELGSPLGLLGMTSPALKSLLAFHLLYFTAVWAVKMSILSFCYSVFGTGVNSRVKLFVWSVMGLATTHFVVAFSTTLFACNPISALWNPLLFNTSCFNIVNMQIAHSVINACTDLMVFALPIHLLSRTKIDPKKKSFIIAIFALGFIAILASIARILASAILSTTIDKPDNWVLLPISTALEVDIAITSASLPSLSPIIRSGLEKFSRKTGINCWVSRFRTTESDEQTKPYGGSHSQGYNLTDMKGNGGIQIKREYSVVRSDTVHKGFTSSTRTVPLPTRAMKSPRSATYERSDVSLADMLKEADDDSRRLIPPRTPQNAQRGPRGKANEVLGV